MRLIGFVCQLVRLFEVLCLLDVPLDVPLEAPQNAHQVLYFLEVCDA